MKEKIKKFFTNKENLLIIYMIFMSIFGFLLSYLGGLAALNYDTNITTANVENKKLNDNISIKRAFDNAPTKEISLPSFDSTFKIFLNCSTYEELYNFVDSLEILEEKGNYFNVFNGVYDNVNLKIDYRCNLVGTSNNIDQKYIKFYTNDFYLRISYTYNFNNFYFFLSEDNGSDFRFNVTDSSVNQYITELNNIMNYNYLSINDNTLNILNDNFYLYGYDSIKNTPNFLTEFLNSVADITLGVGGVLTQAVIGVGSILFFNEELTIVGVGLAMALGVGAVYLIFRMVRGLIKRNDRG